MQIVIDISEDAYKRHKKRVNMDMCTELDIAVAKGTLLQKGHGRIADMDEAIECIKECEGDDAIWAISLIEWACAKRTILEADKAESEKI